MSAPAAQALYQQPTAIEVFELRAWARAKLVSLCLMDFYEAIDGLQAAAADGGLVDELGQDAVQSIIAAEFDGCRQ